ncbi:MAG: O-methyltransferase [Anaerolineales bacterium]|nr:O-methyltransferase [Anaerolineales bacterium]
MPVYNQALSDYITRTYAQGDPTLESIRHQIVARGLPGVSIRPEEGRFLQFLVAACGARLALEIGTLGGYSGVWITRGLGNAGRLISIERNPRHAEIAREHFDQAGVSDQVEVRVGEALQLLPQVAGEGPFDFLFIDAEKVDYPAYLDWTMENLRPGGIITAHNAFRRGRIVNQEESNPGLDAVRIFNQRLAENPRFIATIYPAGDGISVAVLTE